MLLLAGIPLQLLLAFALDICVGDPRWIPHPVRYIGKLIEFSEGRLRNPARPPLINILSGALAVAGTVGITYGVAYVFAEIILAPLRQYTMFHSISLYDITIGITGSLVLAQNGLVKSVLLVRDNLEGGDTTGARAALSQIVGRDTEALTHEGIAKAAIETAAENTSDAIIAPLFYFAIGGLPLALAYKAVNTLDSMLGYKNDRYLYFGRAAARVDDAANYIPARLTGIIMVLAVVVIAVVKLLCYIVKSFYYMVINVMNKGSRKTLNSGSHIVSCFGSITGSLKTLIRDGQNHTSPNAGIPEAAMAGALGIRLGGPSYYGGLLANKPYLGGASNEPVTAEKITEAITITAVSSSIGLMAAVALAGTIKYFWGIH
ncbi:MAG: cobalamin biosynthesis protein CobD [Nitrospirae bacterium]|nr:cobalamin biosynthesis protein CobD [Nitrospirota bacterium]